MYGHLFIEETAKRLMAQPIEHEELGEMGPRANSLPRLWRLFIVQEPDSSDRYRRQRNCRQ